MTFAFVETKAIKAGGKKYVWGTWDGTGGTGGDITVPMGVVESFDLQLGTGSVVSTEPVVNETLPLKNGGVVSIVCTSGALGWYFAIGK